ncbi:MAG: GTP-binding protein [Leptospirales bacterium]
MSITEQDQMNIVIVGHVDHGKSTVIGRLLADTGSLPDGKLESVKENCKRNSKPFEYAFLLDALKDEQAQGITIDAARVFFKSDKRHYIIIDAPGHIEFLKNMITGASRAEAALLVIDAAEGVQENSRRHGYMLSMLGIKQVVVLVNKMDLVEYDEKVFNAIQKEYNEFLSKIGLKPAAYIPVSGMNGVNIAGKNSETSWFDGMNVLEALDMFQVEAAPHDKPFRMPVQDVYKFTRFGDNRRIIAGTVETGRLHKGDTVMFLPSGKKSVVDSIEAVHKDGQDFIESGMAGGFTLAEQIYVTRGEMAVKVGEAYPEVSTTFQVSLFWLAHQPMVEKKEYFIKIGTSKVAVKLEKINGIIDASNLGSLEKNQVERHDVADCTLVTQKALAFDLSDEISATSRFVIIDNYEITGGGIIRKSVENTTSDIRNHIQIRNYKWEKGSVTMARRAERLCQRPTLVIITGGKEQDKKTLAKSLEEKLFEDGRYVYYLGIGNVKYGVDADLVENKQNGREHVRRLAEVAHIVLDLGAVLIVTASDLDQEHLEVIKASINPEVIQTIWVGNEVTTDIQNDLHILDDELETTDCVARIKENLQDIGTFFKVWN